MALAAGDDAPLVQRPHGDQVVLAADHYVLGVGAPADAQETAEVGPGDAQQLHRVVVEHPQEAVLRGDGEHRAAGREAELVDAAVLRAERPLVQRIARRLGLARQNSEPVAGLEALVAGCRRRARQLLVVQIQMAGCVRGEKHVRRLGQPLQASDFRFIDQALKNRRTNGMKVARKLSAESNKFDLSGALLYLIRLVTHLFIVQSIRLALSGLNELYLSGREAD